MPQLRELLSGAGMGSVRTYLQSGNVVVCSDAAPDELAAECERQLMNGLGLDISVIARTRDELAEVVRRNPLGDVAENPKRYQVSFLNTELRSDVVEHLGGLATESEHVVAIGREVYAYHPGASRARSCGRAWRARASARPRPRATGRRSRACWRWPTSSRRAGS